MTTATLADWTTPQPFALPDLGPGLDGERREAVEAALRSIAADPTVQALVVFGSRATGSARPTSDLDLTANQADPPWQEPAKDPSGSSTPGWIANTSPSVPSSSTVTGHPMVTPSSLTRSNATIDSGAGPQTREPAIARQLSSPERNNRPAAMPEAEPLIMPSTLSFSPEEEQELAKGLLLVVLG